MSKGSDALDLLTDSVYYALIECNEKISTETKKKYLEAYNTIDKELKALEIVKPYIHIYCVAPNDRGGVRIWFTQDGKHYIDIPQEKYDLLKEVLS